MRGGEDAIGAMAAEPSLPVVLFDGYQEISVGMVILFPYLSYKGFQSMISQIIGISPHQFSVYISDRTRRGFRIPVTGKTNFSAISRTGGFYFLVVLKRSRRERRRRSTKGEQNLRNRFDPPQMNVMLLRRDGNGGYGFQAELDTGGLAGFERRVSEVHMERERYLMNMGLGLESLSLGLEEGSRSPRERSDGGVIVCEECSGSEGGRDPEFHWCVNDPVTSGFRSPAGPISRPAREEPFIGCGEV
ncbi:hypothetical protein LINPERPRIM_LOCUS16394 [Linum perenne]